MTKSPKIVILFGRSGCGKGTQAKLLQKDFKFDYLGTGDLVRARVKQNDFSGRKLKEVLKNGKLAPTFLVFNMWSEAIGQIKKNKGSRLKGLIVDGSPRALIEARLMDQVFDWYDWQNVQAVLIDVSEQEAYDRLTKRRICQDCGRLIPWVEGFKDLKTCDKCQGKLISRPDDTPKAIKSRLTFYKENVQPAVDFYKKEDRLIKVNGEQSIDQVYQEILKKLKLK